MNIVADVTKKNNSSQVNPEEVLLQITLAFMVFLGFLVSDEVVSKSALQYQMKGLERGLAEADNSKISELCEMKMAKQKYELLEKWWKERSTLPLFQLVSVYSDPNSSLWETDIDKILQDGSFKRMHVLSNQYFGNESEKELKKEIGRILKEITGKEPHELEKMISLQKVMRQRTDDTTARKATQSGEITEGVLQLENLALLNNEISKDFQGVRQKIKGIQEKAFAEYLNKGIDQGDIKKYKKRIEDWDKQLPMLPELKQGLLKTDAMVN